MLDPLTFMVVNQRAKSANLNSSETLKATLLGSVAGGGNIAASVFLADRFIKQKIEANKPKKSIQIEPDNCMDNLTSSIEKFLACMAQDEDNPEFYQLSKTLLNDTIANLDKSIKCKNAAGNSGQKV